MMKDEGLKMNIERLMVKSFREYANVDKYENLRTDQVCNPGYLTPKQKTLNSKQIALCELTYSPYYPR